MSEIQTHKGGTDGFDGLEYVRAEPPMILASVIGVYDGRCAVAYYGAAGRCSADAEYKTSINWEGESQYIALCPKHADPKERQP